MSLIRFSYAHRNGKVVESATGAVAVGGWG